MDSNHAHRANAPDISVHKEKRSSLIQEEENSPFETTQREELRCTPRILVEKASCDVLATGFCAAVNGIKDCFISLVRIVLKKMIHRRVLQETPSQSFNHCSWSDIFKQSRIGNHQDTVTVLRNRATSAERIQVHSSRSYRRLVAWTYWLIRHHARAHALALRAVIPTSVSGMLAVARRNSMLSILKTVGLIKQSTIVHSAWQICRKMRIIGFKIFCQNVEAHDCADKSSCIQFIWPVLDLQVLERLQASLKHEWCTQRCSHRVISFFQK